MPAPPLSVLLSVSLSVLLSVLLLSLVPQDFTHFHLHLGDSKSITNEANQVISHFTSGFGGGKNIVSLDKVPFCY